MLSGPPESPPLVPYSIASTPTAQMCKWLQEKQILRTRPFPMNAKTIINYCEVNRDDINGVSRKTDKTTTAHPTTILKTYSLSPHSSLGRTETFTPISRYGKSSLCCGAASAVEPQPVATATSWTKL